MTLEHLHNLVKARQLKPEPPDQVEFVNLGGPALARLSVG
jgi:hypothetical protein